MRAFAATLLPAHGGSGLRPLFVENLAQDTLRNLPRVPISERGYGDLLMLGMGGFTPLTGFMTRDEWHSVCDGFQLPDGTFWPMPVLLDVDADSVPSAAERVVLTYNERSVGVLTVREVWHMSEADIRLEAERIYRGHGKDSQEFWATAPARHPGVQHIFSRKRTFLGGKLDVLVRDERFSPDFLLSPADFRSMADARGWKNIISLQLRNPPHRSHEYLARIGLELGDALLIHTPVGALKEGDLPADIRLACIRAMVDNYLPRDRVVVAGYPLDMRYAGPREALLHATFRQNYGVSCQIVGRDHAGVADFYEPFESQTIFDTIPVSDQPTKDLLTRPLCVMWPFFCKKCGCMATLKTCPHTPEDRVLHSGSLLRKCLTEGSSPPEGLLRPEVTAILQDYYQNHTATMVAPLYGAASGATMPESLSTNVSEVQS
ncbi:MAG: sulfate adenylyltransferase [Bilophila sp.]